MAFLFVDAVSFRVVQGFFPLLTLRFTRAKGLAVLISTTEYQLAN